MHYLPFHPEDERRASFCGTSKCWSWICASVCLSECAVQAFACACMRVDVLVCLYEIFYTSVHREERIWPPLVRDLTL